MALADPTVFEPDPSALVGGIQDVPTLQKTARRSRMRKNSLKLDKAAIVDRVIGFFDKDEDARSEEAELRLQRYAKLRMWTESKDWPWPDASNLPLPDMMEKVLRLEDTLHNAILSQRPAIGAKAFQAADVEKARRVDDLIDFQLFVEQPGEEIIGSLASAFVEEGTAFAFVPWVREQREISDLRIFDPLPDEAEPVAYFEMLLRQTFPEAVAIPDGDGWDWRLADGEESFTVAFYTKPDNRIELVARRVVTVYDGPSIQPVEWSDVLFPPRAGNLQRPGPANPDGATHVILRKYPTIDEVRRLAKSGYYDLIPKKDLESLDSYPMEEVDNEAKMQIDRLQGAEVQQPQREASSHKTLTLLMCFDCFDIDGDGIDEDVIFWVLKEPKMLIKAKLLTELFPASKPIRPLFASAFIPIRHRVCGIGLPELVEPIHDATKTIFDQMIDAGTLSIAPFGFYRASGGMRPEAIALMPGELYPLSDPQRDVNFPQIGNPQALGFGLNMVTLLGTMEERLTMIGDLQLGRVPAGRASALRTIGGQQMLQGQGEARPERILRRFFMLLREIWAFTHELNRHFLPEGKKYRIANIQSAGQDPYQTLTDRSMIDAEFQFDFSANVLNTSKQALQESMAQIMATLMSPIMIQAGIVTPENIYRMQRDFIRAWGQDPDQYMTPPLGADMVKISAEDAFAQVLRSQVPDGWPKERGGWMEHVQKLQAIMAADLFGLLMPEQVPIFQEWVAQATAQAQAQMMMQMQMAAQAGAQGQPGQQDRGGAPTTTGPGDVTGTPQVSGPNEMIDETMPTAGGGGAQAR